ncbi:GNAT family N-acetyltransferase [Pedobacter sp. Hv1]|uniref:GNAT family N-acetyltransferase n=1 Tax=Pedobacter sp. Hv1 TaxID=1740090 RepID=UPI0006D8989D|nr:GNAT family N-acetyltransferase [Pedobacter sp. Hv1]KQB98631.1 GNAT family acetyltransferase [Pedobacter sp. Hv1]
MNTLQITSVSKNDIPELQKISRQTFLETFADTNTEENMKQYLAESFALAQLTEEVENPESKFFFAVWNNEVIGYLKINTGQAQTELKGNDSLEIERIYVQQAFLGKKVGQSLFDHAIGMAQDAGFHTVWLGVWENNQRAIHFYQKNGFVTFDKHAFYLGDDEQTDLMMRKTLQSI